MAITRAMRSLKLNHCAERRKYGQFAPCHPSSFLKELPEELVERAEDRRSEPVTEAQGKDYFAAMRAKLAGGRPA